MTKNITKKMLEDEINNMTIFSQIMFLVFIFPAVFVLSVYAGCGNVGLGQIIASNIQRSVQININHRFKGAIKNGH